MTVKLCKDCVFYKQGASTGTDECIYTPQPQEPVRGGQKYTYCAALRIHGCGEEAKWFSPREPEKREAQAA